MATSHFGNGNERLDSWKEISAYLKRGVRTVQRWEREAGLPVHRLATEKRGVVHAYKAEIDLWWQTRSGLLEAQETAEPIPSRRRLHWRALAWISIPVVGASVVALALLHPQKELRLDQVRRIT